ncbi:MULTISPECIES: MFS transporter [Actinoalloteichus]|uniref:Arabinose efflux permease family protein n=1 Tax=Actinoalloteichus fjordicus TaxID=1612552 RepID=A0AAC9PT09_9PSEU|nr:MULTISPECIES: MFS transporter [Actinoalloteichus]APU15562.1 arabinose efflux permease family protein [Actinoalloteichus fjordicus]APU21629.1 arabinose efflux permease family protein [Actinoalloteichus sp. GBA129-24]
MIAFGAGADSARRRHDFRLFWIGGAANLLGSHASALVLPILVLAVGGTPMTAGLVGTAGGLVEVLFRPIAGVYADRGSRRRLMAVAALVAAAAMGAIAIGAATGTASLPLLLIAAVVEGLAAACYAAAASGGIKAVLPAESPESALGALQAREQGARLAGPGIGGALYQLAAWVPFLVDALSYLVAALCARGMRSELRADRDPSTPPDVRRGFRREFGSGLRFLWSRPFLRFVSLWAAGLNLIVGALYFQVILHARIDGWSAAVLGLVLSVAGAAGLAGALTAPMVLRRFRPSLLVVVVSWVIAAVVLAFAVVSSAVGVGVLLALVSFLTPALSIVFQSKAIMMTPDRLQGRVGTAIGTLGEGTAALAPLLAGALVTVLSPAQNAVVLAAGLVLLALYATVSVRAATAAVEPEFVAEPGSGRAGEPAAGAEPVAGPPAGQSRSTSVEE